VEQTLKVVDRAVIVHEGKKLAEDVPKALINNQQVREAYLGNTFRGDEFD
jgi:lipopolysaccharide export system ATP-binding protein